MSGNVCFISEFSSLPGCRRTKAFHGDDMPVRLQQSSALSVRRGRPYSLREQTGVMTLRFSTPAVDYCLCSSTPVPAVGNALVTAPLCGDMAEDRRQGKGNTAAASTAGASAVRGSCLGLVLQQEGCKRPESSSGVSFDFSLVCGQCVQSALVQ